MNRLILLVASLGMFFGTAVAQGILWTENGAGSIDSSAFVGTGFHAIDTGLVTPYGIAVDADSGWVFWTNVTGNEIWRANLDGIGKIQINIQSQLGLSLPRGIAIDGAAGRMYWVENGRKEIRSSDLNGSSVAEILVTGLSAPTGIAVDAQHAKLYWTDNGGTEKKVGMCGTDGSNPLVIDSTTNFVSGISVDTVNDRIYWAEYGPSNRIESAKLDGSDVTTVDSMSSSHPRGVFVDPMVAKVFWTSYLTNMIESSNLDGTGRDTIASGLNNPMSVVVALLSNATGVRSPAGTAGTFRLYQNYPNPFNPATIISYELPANSYVTLKVYDILGREVATLVNQTQQVGTHEVSFDGRRLPSGVYFYRMLAVGSGGRKFESVKKLLLMK